MPKTSGIKTTRKKKSTIRKFGEAALEPVRDITGKLAEAIPAVQRAKEQETEKRIADQQAQTGIIKPPERTPIQPPTKRPEFEVLTDSETGEVTGFNKGGRTIFRPPGISDAEWQETLDRAAGKETRRGLMPEDIQGAVTRQEVSQRENRQQALELMSLLGAQQLNFEDLSPDQLDLIQAITSGTAGAGIGAGTGAIAGAIGGGGVGAIPGAAIGFAGGALQGIRSNIRAQITGQIGTGTLSVRQLERNMNDAIRLINSGDDPNEAVLIFYESYGEIRRRRGVTKANQDQWLAKAVGVDATKELARFEIFEDYTFPTLERELSTALLNPNPQNIRVSSITFGEENETTE